MRRKVLSIITALAMLMGSLQPAAVIAAESGSADSVMAGEEDADTAVVEDADPVDSIEENVGGSAVEDVNIDDESHIGDLNPGENTETIAEDIVGDPASGAHSAHCFCGGGESCGTDHNGNLVWNAWVPSEHGNAQLPTTTGNWYLTEDVTLAESRSYSVSGTGDEAQDVKLCLNGHIIHMNGNQYTVTGESSLTVTNCKTTGGIDPTYDSDYNGRCLTTPLMAAGYYNCKLSVYNITFDDFIGEDGISVDFAYDTTAMIHAEQNSWTYSAGNHPELFVSGCRADIMTKYIPYDGIHGIYAEYSGNVTVRDSEFKLIFTGEGHNNYPNISGLYLTSVCGEINISDTECSVITGAREREKTGNPYGMYLNQSSDYDGSAGGISVKNCVVEVEQNRGDLSNVYGIRLLTSSDDVELENCQVTATSLGGTENSERGVYGAYISVDDDKNRSLTLKDCQITVSAGDQGNPGSETAYGVYLGECSSFNIISSKENGRKSLIEVNTFDGNEGSAYGIIVDRSVNTQSMISDTEITVNGSEDAQNFGINTKSIPLRLDASTVTVTGGDTSRGIDMWQSSGGDRSLCTFTDSRITAPLYGIYANNAGKYSNNVYNISLDGCTVVATVPEVGEAVHFYNGAAHDSDAIGRPGIYLAGETILSGDKCGLFKDWNSYIYAYAYGNENNVFTPPAGTLIMIYPNYDEAFHSSRPVINGGMTADLVGVIELTGVEGYSIGADGKLAESAMYEISFSNEGEGRCVAKKGGSIITLSPVRATGNSLITIEAIPAQYYKFNRWQVVSGGITLAEKTAATTTFTLGTNDVAIKAYFDEDNYRQVTYNGGAYSDGTVVISPSKKYVGSPLTLSSAVFKDKRGKYTQTGWSKTDGGDKDFALGGTYEADEDMTLYPFWEINHTVKYLFGLYPPEGKKTGDVAYEDVKCPGADLTIRSFLNMGNTDIADKTKDGDGHWYICRGWTTDKDRELSEYDPEDKYTADADLTLYPAWERMYEIRYSGGDHAVETTDPDPQYRYKTGDNTSVYLYYEKYTDSRGLYYQDGWSVRSDGTTKDHTFGEYYSGTEDLDLYPYWEKYIIITYDPGAYGTAINDDAVYDKKKKGYSIGFSDALFTREGYTQIGWSKTDGSATADYSFTATYGKDQDITVYPVWQQDRTITYMPGHRVQGVSPVVDVKHKGIASTIRGNIFGNDDLEFIGWSADGENDTVEYEPLSSYGTDENLVLYPVWRVRSYALWIGDTQVTVENKDDVVGDGSVKYDPTTSTLTLKGAHIDSYKDINEWNTDMVRRAGIVALNDTTMPKEADADCEEKVQIADYALNTLTIVPVGADNVIDPIPASEDEIAVVTYGIYSCDVSLEVAGEGTLTIGTATAGADLSQAGIFARSSYDYTGRKNDFKKSGPSILNIYAGHYGLWVDNMYPGADGVVMNYGEINVTVTASDAAAVYSTRDSAKAVVMKGGSMNLYTTGNSKTVTQGGESYTFEPVLIKAYTENSDALLMEGGTLNLENKGNAGWSIDSVTDSDNPGEGEGDGQDGGYGYYDVRYEAGTVTATSKSGIIKPHTSYYNRVFINKNAVIKAGASAQSAVVVEDLYQDYRYAYISGGVAPSKTYLNLWGKAVTDDALSGEGYSYDPASGTLTLTGFEGMTDVFGEEECAEGEEAGTYGIECDSSLIINLEGVSSIGLGDATPSHGIYIGGDLEITGDGHLDLAGSSFGMYVNNDVKMKSGSVDVCSGGQYGIFCYGDVYVSGGNLDVTGSKADKEITESDSKSDYGISAGNITVTGGELNVRAGCLGIDLNEFDHGIFTQTGGHVVIMATGGKNPENITRYDPRGVCGLQGSKADIKGGDLYVSAYNRAVSLYDYAQSGGNVSFVSECRDNTFPYYNGNETLDYYNMAFRAASGSNGDDQNLISVTGGSLYCESEHMVMSADKDHRLVIRGGLVRLNPRSSKIVQRYGSCAQVRYVDIYDGRLEAKGSQYGFFYGTYSSSLVNMNVYGGSLLIDLSECTDSENRYPVYKSLSIKMPVWGYKTAKDGNYAIGMSNGNNGYIDFCDYYDGTGKYDYVEVCAINTVIYKPGVNGSGESIKALKIGGEPLMLKGAVFTREGFVQTGWSKTDGEAKVFDLGASYDRDEGVTLYPVWKESRKISYKPGDGVQGQEYDDQVPENSDVILRGKTYTKANAVQKGWNTASDGMGKGYALQEVVTVSGNMILYPSWDETIRVTYEKGIRGTGFSWSEIHGVGSAFTLEDAIFTRIGYTMDGWALSDGGAKVYDLEQSVSFDEDTVLYPAWKINKSVEPDDPSGSSSSSSSSSTSSSSTRPNTSSSTRPDNTSSTRPDTSSSTKPDNTSSTKPDASSSSDKKDDTSSAKKDDTSSSAQQGGDENGLTGPLKKTDVTCSVKDENGKLLVDSVWATTYVTYDQKKHVAAATAKAGKETGDVTVKVEGEIHGYAAPVYKFKNNKDASGKKQPFFTVGFKASKSATKEQKKLIKAVNKELKNQRIGFDIKPADLTTAVVTGSKGDPKKGKLSWFTVSLNGNTFKLKKKDFDFTAKDEGFEVKGKGNFTGTVLVKQ